MAPNQHVQKPYKVLAEQYHAADQPPIAGVCLLGDTPLYPAGVPHVHTSSPLGVFAPAEGDWIVTEIWTPHNLLLMSDAEFTDRFGGTV